MHTNQRCLVTLVVANVCIAPPLIDDRFPNLAFATTSVRLPALQALQERFSLLLPVRHLLHFETTPPLRVFTNVAGVRSSIMFC